MPALFLSPSPPLPLSPSLILSSLAGSSISSCPSPSSSSSTFDCCCCWSNSLLCCEGPPRLVSCLASGDQAFFSITALHRSGSWPMFVLGRPGDATLGPALSAPGAHTDSDIIIICSGCSSSSSSSPLLASSHHSGAGLKHRITSSDDGTHWVYCCKALPSKLAALLSGSQSLNSPLSHWPLRA